MDCAQTFKNWNSRKPMLPLPKTGKKQTLHTEKQEKKEVLGKYFGNLKGRNPVILLTFAAFLSIILFCKVSS